MKKLKGEDLLAEFKSVLKVECDIHYCGNLNSETLVNQLKTNIQIADITIPSQTPIYRELQLINEPTVYFIDNLKSSQSIIDAYVVGGLNKDLKARAAGELFNNYFGGSMSSLVFQQIREFRSLAYRANAKYVLGSYKHRDKAGQFIAKLSTQCDKTIDAMGVLDSLIKQMPAKAERVETAQQDLINEANNNYPSFRNRSLSISNLKNNGFSIDPNIELIDNVNNMSIGNIVEFYNQNIKGRNLAYIVVGNSKKIDMTKLATFGKIVKVLPTEVFK
jgi:predicted Zn-dependent peptidase